MWIYFRKACMVYLLLLPLRIARATNNEDLITPNETHLEGVPRIIRQPKPLYYTTKNHPAIVDCVAEPVSYVVVECAEQVIPYGGPDASGRLKVTRLNSANRPDPDGMRWRIEIQIHAKEVEEWFDSYVCHFEVWNGVPFLKRPKKIVSETAVITEAYLKRNFKLKPISTTLILGQRLEMVCSPPEGRPEPEVYWTKDGMRISLALFPQIQIDGESRLIIEDTKNSDSGNYTCVADLFRQEFRYAHAIVKVLEPVEEKMIKPQTHYSWMHAREATLCATLFSVVTVVLLVLFVVVAARTKIQNFSAKYWHLNRFCALNLYGKDDYKPASIHSRARTCYSKKAHSPATSAHNIPTHVKNKYTQSPPAIKPDPVSGIYETLEHNEVVIRHALIYSNPLHGYGSYAVTTSSQLLASSVIPPYNHLNISRWTSRNLYFGHPFFGLKIDLPITSAHFHSADTSKTHYEHLDHAEVQSSTERLYDNSDTSRTFVKPADQSSVYAFVPHEKSSSENCLSSSSSRTTPSSSVRENGFSGPIHADGDSMMDDTKSQCSIFEHNSSTKSAVKDCESKLSEINYPLCSTVLRHQFDIHCDHQALVIPITQFGSNCSNLDSPAAATASYCFNTKQGGWCLPVPTPDISKRRNNPHVVAKSRFISDQLAESEYSTIQCTTMEQSCWKH
ncbi:hypothetical protein CRM22_006803 [Opisthorchis felineus]|nr:hypothetical protein CRM22_006803 [Opisthorchis felineus]